MNKVKKGLYTMLAGMVAGMIVGILYAPEKGSETRKKLRRIKDWFMHTDGDLDTNRKALEELRDVLQMEVVVVQEKIEMLP